MVKLSAKAKGKGKATPQAKDVGHSAHHLGKRLIVRRKNPMQPRKKSDPLVNPNVKKINPRKSN